MITEHRAPCGPAITVGRYMMLREIARGGMATVHLARLIGDEGFSRIVAAKRLHPELAQDQAFLAMFLAEARITSKLRHRNIVPVLDVVTSGGQVVLVQEYVHGAPLHWLLEQARLEQHRVPIEIAVSIACQVLSGLHAAHVLTDELGQPLDVVHRDVSPQNVMIATDGTARLLDFGVAKVGVDKGKVAYSAPEQLRGAAMPQSDVYSLAVVLWELLVGQRMHEPQSESELVVAVLNGHRPRMRETLWKKASSIPSEMWAQLEALEPIVERGLALSIADRWTTAEELEHALRAVITPAPASAVAQWMKQHGKDYLDLHERVISAEESSWRARPVRLAVGSTPPETSGLRLLPRVGTRAPRASLMMKAPAPLPPVPPSVTAPHAQPVPEWRGHGAVIAVLGALILAALAGIVLVVRSSSHAADAPPLLPASEPAQGIISRPGPRLPAQPAQRGARDATGQATARDLETGNTAPRNAAAGTATARNLATGNAAARDLDTGNPAPRNAAAGNSAARNLATGTATARNPATGNTASGNAAASSSAAAPAPTKPAPPRPPARAAVRAPAVRAVVKPRSEAAPVPAKSEPPAGAAAIDCTPPYYYEGAKKYFKPTCL